MTLAPEPTAVNPLPRRVLEALLEFEQKPGRYPVARREPALLFEQVGTVLQLASERAVEGLSPVGAAQALEARRAARYFVRTVMLRPGTDHYTLLGLTPASPPAMQRDHYRMMIRLAHPDFATADEAWPADAASRINFANDVLCSPVQRHLYNTTLVPESPVSAALRVKPTPKPTPKAMPWNGGGDGGMRRWLTRRGPIAMSTVLLLAGFWWLFSDPGHQGVLMVKRPPTAPLVQLRPLDPQGAGLLLETRIHSSAPGARPAVFALDDVQPTMDQVLGALRSGRGETVLQVLNNEWRSHPSTTRFVGDFNQRLAGRTVRGLDEVKSSASSADGMFVVESAIDFQLQNALQQKETLRLNLKAVFLAQEGAPVLTQLVAQP
jgi:hypothetical protein